MAVKNGFRVTDPDGNLLAEYDHQSEVKTYLRASYGDNHHIGIVVDKPNMRLVEDDDGKPIAQVIGDWKDD